MLNLIKNFLRGPWGRTALVTFAFLVLAAGLFWLDFFRAYESETAVLFRVENGQSAGEVALSLQAVLESGAFFERMEKDFPEVVAFSEAKSALSHDEKRALWQDHVRTEVPEGTGVLIFFVTGTDQTESRELTVAATKTLFLATNLYYQKENNVDVRVIEGPLFSLTVSHPILYGLTTLGTALLFTSLFFGGLALFSKPSSLRHQEQETVRAGKMPELPTATEGRIGESVAWIDPKKFLPVRPSNLEMAYREEEMPVSTNTPFHKASAPGNLPVLEEMPQFQFEEVEEMKEEALSEPVLAENTKVWSSEEEGTGQLKDLEPSVEEYKRRLNELLRGKSLT